MLQDLADDFCSCAFRKCPQFSEGLLGIELGNTGLAIRTGWAVFPRFLLNAVCGVGGLDRRFARRCSMSRNATFAAPGADIQSDQECLFAGRLFFRSGDQAHTPAVTH